MRDALTTGRLPRIFVSLLAACLAWFGPADLVHAQQTKTPRHVGVLFVLLAPDGKEAQAFQEGLREAGYTEGRDAVIEWRSANGDYARLPELAAELVNTKVDVIVADTTFAAQSVKHATSTIPIVMTLVADPVGSGLVTNLAQLGGNVTGLSIMLAELSAKRLQLLKESIPKLHRVVVVWNRATPYQARAVDNLKAVAPSLAIELSFVEVRTAEQFDAAFSAISRAHAQALYVLDAPLFFAHRATLLKQAAKARLPVMSGEKPFADAGALMTYGANYADQMRRSAEYVDKILKGAKPAELPIEQPTKFDFVINLRTAKALGIAVPESVVFRADEVIR
jgi:putative ABC transport system substrate-binding protein